MPEIVTTCLELNQIWHAAEPFEEFGYSPRYEEPNYCRWKDFVPSTGLSWLNTSAISIDEGQSSPVHNVTSGIPVQPVRSLSFRLGQDSKEPASEDYSTSRATNGDANAQAGAGGKAGLKRTRSLLQRLRSMVSR
jgi:hypothetical protein